MWLSDKCIRNTNLLPLSCLVMENYKNESDNSFCFQTIWRSCWLIFLCIQSIVFILAREQSKLGMYVIIILLRFVNFYVWYLLKKMRVLNFSNLLEILCWRRTFGFFSDGGLGSEEQVNVDLLGFGNKRRDTLPEGKRPYYVVFPGES